MEKITLSTAALAVIIVMTIPQACISTIGMSGTQCAKPTLTSSGASSATTSVTVTIRTKTAGAYLRYTLDGSTPTGGLSGNGTQIEAASGKISFTVGLREKTFKRISRTVPNIAKQEQTGQGFGSEGWGFESLQARVV